MEDKHILDIAIGLVFNHGQVLISQRQPDAHLGLLWEFPGGKVEAGESLEAAVAREILEETGLQVAAREVYHVEVAEYPERTVRLHFLKCHLQNAAEVAKPLAATQLRWVPLQELDKYDFPSGNQSLLAKLKTAIGG